ncbi:hypothetical protein DsansV1_C16g0139601 [Dioscorea sansibarensis]
MKAFSSILSCVSPCACLERLEAHPLQALRGRTSSFAGSQTWNSFWIFVFHSSWTGWFYESMWWMGSHEPFSFLLSLMSPHPLLFYAFYSISINHLMICIYVSLPFELWVSLVKCIYMYSIICSLVLMITNIMTLLCLY